MKNIQKLALFNLSVCILSTIVMACWYSLLHKSLELNVQNITKIVIEVGLVSAIFPAIIFISIYYLIKKISNKLLLTFLIFISFVFLMYWIYWISINMIFYDISDSKSFLESLMETFEP